jgi:hypothetical protein
MAMSDVWRLACSADTTEMTAENADALPNDDAVLALADRIFDAWIAHGHISEHEGKDGPWMTTAICAADVALR